MRYMIAAILLGATAVPAQALVITFNGEGDQYQSLISSSGFDFAFTASGWGLVNGDFASTPGQNVTNGTSRVMLSGGSPGRVLMTRQGGGTFTLNGLDIAAAFKNTVGEISIIGTFADATTISKNFEVGGSYKPVGLTGFTNLVSVTFREAAASSGFGDHGIGIDNLSIDAAVVPEPASWAMMIAGFGLVGAGMRRRATRIVYA